MPLTDLKNFALTKGVKLKEQKEIAKIASDNIARRFGYNQAQIKEHFDSLIWETEKEAYKVYLGFEKTYGQEVFTAFGDHLIDTGELTELARIGKILGSYLTVFDRFFLSMAQSRRTRAGNSFESLQNALFKELAYPFDEQKVIIRRHYKIRLAVYNPLFIKRISKFFK